MKIDRRIFSTYKSVDPIPTVFEDMKAPVLLVEPLHRLLDKVEEKVIERRRLFPDYKESSTKKTPTKKKTVTRHYSGADYESFNRAYDAVERRDPSAKEYREFLTELASKESGFDLAILNLEGAPAYGYFQFWEDGKTNNISSFAGTNIESFLSNPELLIESAIRLAKSFERLFTKEDIELAKKKGYNRWALLAGAWLAGVGGVRTFLRDQGNPSDRHWSKTGKGTSVKERMEAFLYKEGGKIDSGEEDKSLIDKFINYIKDFIGLSDSNSETTLVSKPNPKPVEPKSIETLPYAQTLRFIRHLENPRNKGIRNGIAYLYDSRTGGYGTDIVSGHPELANDFKNGKISVLQAKDIAVTDMRKHDLAILQAFKDLKLTDRPDTISIGPRLLMAQARYHYGNIRESMPEWGKAVVRGDSDSIKQFALNLAKGYGARYDKIKDMSIYGDNSHIK